jgi:hypothetical protein
MNVFVKPRSFVPSTATTTPSTTTTSSSSSGLGSSVPSLLAGGKRKLDQIEEVAPPPPSAAATTAVSSSDSSTTALTRSLSVSSVTSLADTTVDQRAHVIHLHDQEMLKELDALLRTFVDEVLPCTSEQELFDVIGILFTFTSYHTTPSLTDTHLCVLCPM